MPRRRSSSIQSERRLAAAAAGLHRAGLVDRAAVQQQLLGQRRLAGVRVGDDRERPPPRRLGDDVIGAGRQAGPGACDGGLHDRRLARGGRAGTDTLRGAMKRYHVTTFGCQMNEHDSERMKGMLDALGYAEARGPRGRRRDPLQHLLDPREGRHRFLAHLGHAKRLKREDPARIIGVGGCWAQSVKDEVFARFPFVDVAFGPGQVHKLAEFLTSDSLTAQGFFEFEGFTGHLPGKRAREFQAWVQISVGCN